MFKQTITKNGETKTTINWTAIISIIAIFTFAIITFIVIRTTTTNKKREEGRLLTISSFYETEPHRETVAMWDYDNNYTNEHYTNIEYYEYSGTFVVEVSTYQGEYLGKFEINPKYYGEDKIYIGAEIEKYKLQPIKREVEKVAKEAPNKEVLQEIKPVEKQEVEQKLVSIKNKWVNKFKNSSERV